jgi:hypothetical protein
MGQTDIARHVGLTRGGGSLGLADIARQVIGCHVRKITRMQNALNDISSDT